ncbi:hypothetical protein AYP1020_p34 (plasmid) [Staphylococcus capitis subsp. capitis]|uniref:hypothetical protein n=1 Tax=Staphylococcus capitis TaxID=29388 RepID=UPI00064AFFA7|nr:hypothetical protein [Staphylococcus capitis]AKL93489.1 hypothetical protein AYP1020_p34 [Staphylococcus capitis subsp. capitis]
MVTINLFGTTYEIKKSKYMNERLALILVNDRKEYVATLSQNIEDALLMSEALGESNHTEFFVNHLDFYDYMDVLDELEKTHLFKKADDNLLVKGNVRSGFNTYLLIEIKESILDEMEEY